MDVSVRDLKSHLSEYLVRARKGEEIEITSHRKVICRLVGVPDTERPAGLENLLLPRVASWDGGKPAGSKIKLASGGKSISEILLEERG